MESMDRLLAIMTRLRGPDGCPWDREQTSATLRTYVLEEAYEVAEAIDDGAWPTLREELGDLLLQVVFLSQIASERGAFSFADVAAALSDKLVRRHPHVFADASADTVHEVWKHWDAVKDSERATSVEGGAAKQPSRLDGIPRHLPALAKARLLADKAARAGLDWPDAAAIVDKVHEEVEEVRAAVAESDPRRVCEEIGDLVFAAASLARRMGLDPEACLEGANRKFGQRFRAVETEVAARGARLEELDPEEVDRLWNRAKIR